MDPDPGPGGPKTYGSDGSGFGSATQFSHIGWQIEAMTMKKTSRYHLQEPKLGYHLTAKDGVCHF
jgi:hypothetical protein